MENERSSDGNRLPSNKYSCPWLMISHPALDEQTFYNILEDRSYCAKMIPDILHKFPISTNQPGWVLVQGKESWFPDVEEEEEDGIDDEEEDDSDNTDDDEDDGDGDEVHEFAQEEDGGGGEENGHALDGDAHEVHDDGEEDDVDDGDEFGHDDDDGNEFHEFGHVDDFGSAYAAEECDDESKAVCFLWNINSSSEKIPITDYKGKGISDTTSYYDRCLLSSSPGESNSIIYLFKETSVFFGRLSDHTFSHRVISGNHNVPMTGAVIAENGKVMCMFGGGTEVVIGTLAYREGWCLDLTRYTIVATDLPLGANCSNPYFIQYQGEVICVKMSTYGENYYNQVHSFWLYRFNFYKKTWELLDDIGQTAIFISANSDYPAARFGIRCSVSDEDVKKGLRPNSIYFTNYSKLIYVFSMEDQTISYFCPCPMVINYHSQWVQF